MEERELIEVGLSRKPSTLTSGTGKEERWNPTVCGLSKRDLLKDVLGIFGMSCLELLGRWRMWSDGEYDVARSKTLTKMALDWQELLKKAASEE